MAMKEYLLIKHLYNGFYNWCIECGLTAHLSIDADELNVPDLPDRFRIKGLTLNVSVGAVGAFSITDDGIYVELRFAGKPCALYVPWQYVRYIGSKETDHMLANQIYGHSIEPEPIPIEKAVRKRPHLTLVK